MFLSNSRRRWRAAHNLRAWPLPCTLVLTAVWLSTIAAAQNKTVSTPVDHARIDEVLSSLNRGRSVGQVAVSPDGKRVAWIQGRRDGGDIFVAPTNDLAKAERISAGVQPDQHCRESEIVWSPS